MNRMMMPKAISLLLIASMILPLPMNALAAAPEAGPNSEAVEIEHMILEYYCQAVVLDSKEAEKRAAEAAAALVATPTKVATPADALDDFYPSDLPAVPGDREEVINDLKLMAKPENAPESVLTVKTCQEEIIKDTRILDLSQEDVADIIADRLAHVSPKLFNDVLARILASYRNARHSSSVAVYPSNPEVLWKAIALLVSKMDLMVSEDVADSRKRGTVQDGVLTFLSGAFYAWATITTVGFGYRAQKGIRQGAKNFKSIWMGGGRGTTSLLSFRVSAEAVAAEAAKAAEASGAAVGATSNVTAIVKYAPAEIAAVKALRGERLKKLMDFISSKKGKIALYAAGGLANLGYRYLRTYRLSPSEMLAEVQRDVTAGQLSVLSGETLSSVEQLESDLKISKIDGSTALEKLSGIRTELAELESDLNYMNSVNASATVEEPIAENIRDAQQVVGRMLKKLNQKGGM